MNNEKIALVFAGQGSQYIGMGKDFFDRYQEVRNMYQEASEILGYDLAKLCFTENDLVNQTIYTQPAVLVTSCAIYEILKKELPFKVNVMSGFSLGEYSALYAAGVYDFKTIVAIVKKRAEYMNHASEKTKGSMAAILGMERDTLKKLCDEIGDVYIANYNSPVQIVVGGKENLVNQLCNHVKTVYNKRAILLNVSGGFHTPLMNSAALKMRDHLKNINYQQPMVDVIMNYNAQPLAVNYLVDSLTKQIESSVLFEDSIKLIIKEYHIDTFIEIGPGRVLSGLIKKIDPTKKIISIDNWNDIEILQGDK